MTSPRYSVGYCTNVHAGVDLPRICDNLDRFAVPVRQGLDRQHGLDDFGRLGVGLWLPAQAASELEDRSKAEQFRQFLADRKLHPFTINGFPYDNFHQPVVKHRVYLPAWWQPERLAYTQQLAEVLASLLSESETVGSISTLPIGWAGDVESQDQIAWAADQLRQLADYLRELESRSGRRIIVAIEPEPGCVLDTCQDVVGWFERHLPESHHRRYLSVCHDICHSSVMRESQSQTLHRYAEAGITVGKVQVSSAIIADWKSIAPQQRSEALEQLQSFAEDRYLHQTGRQLASGQFELIDDLPELLAAASGGNPTSPSDQRWVIHFHVPIFLKRLGLLTTSQPDILECLRTLFGGEHSEPLKVDFSGHLEIETYAWTVLPESMRQRGLSEDILSEFRWLGGLPPFRSPKNSLSR